MESMAEGLIISDNDGFLTYANSRFAEITGYEKEELVGKRVWDVYFENSEEDVSEQVRAMVERYRDRQRGNSEVYELKITRGDGEIRWLEVRAAPLKDPSGEIVGSVDINTDITQRRELEEQLQWSQKMEAVGKLAGGIAHDFNNLLTVISGYSKLMLRQMDSGDKYQGYVSAIHKASEAADVLTQQLLALSRRQVVRTEIVGIGDVIQDSTEILQGLLGKEIALKKDLDPRTRPVQIDPGQLQQILMNLVINARDAMPQGGEITLETFQTGVTNGESAEPAFSGVRVRDNGIGMDSETQTKVFEPFFTTKEKSNSGLGLSTVYGIVKQHRGSISLESEPGVGTEFSILFPVAEGKAIGRKDTDPASLPPVSGENILIVEDETVVRELLEEVLETSGFKVTSVGNADEALQHLEKHSNQINLMLTDIIMPGINGFELTEQVRVQYPALKVIMMSGCTQDSTIPKNIVRKGIPFVPKPICTDSLVWRIREVLDGETSSTSAQG